MYKVFIIDDEKLIREGLTNYIDWESIGFEVCGTAGDGTTGLEAVMQQRPDLVISDIRMPTLSGTELLQQIREADDLDCEVIFISAYSDFESAQIAVRYGAFDYILKPIEEDVLMEVVSRCKEKIIAKNKVRHNYSSINKDNHHDLLRRHLIHDHSDIPPGILLPSGKEASSPLILVFTLDIEDDSYDEAQNPDTRALQEYFADTDCLTVKIIDMYPQRFTGIVCSAPDSQNSGGFYSDTLNRLRRIKSDLAVKGIDVQAGLSDVSVHSADLPYLYIQSSISLLYYQLRSDSSAAEFKKVKADAACVKDEGIEPSAIDALLQLQECPPLDEFFIYNLSVLINSSAIYDSETTKVICLRVLSHLYKSSRFPRKGNWDEVIRVKERAEQRIIREQDVSMFFSTYISAIQSIVRLFRQEPGTYGEDLAQQAIAYIEDNYHEKIYLDQIAGRFNLSVSHFSKLFKEATGESFSLFLQNYRMVKAKELLVDFGNKVYEVAAMVGYPDVSHFSKTFKEHEGISPNEYRRKFVK